MIENQADDSGSSLESARSPRLYAYENKLPRVALKYLMVHAALEVLGVGLVSSMALFWLLPVDWKLPALAVMMVLIIMGLIVDVPIISRLTMRYTSYHVDSDAVRISRGILFSKDMVLSTAQILNISIVDGPLLRKFGLAKVRFTTLNHVEPLGPVSLENAIAIRQEALATYLKADNGGR